MYEELGYAVHRRCLTLLRDPAAADDAVQEVFVRVLKYGHTYRGGSQLAWLKRIADRHCLDRLQKERRYATSEESRIALEELKKSSDPRMDADRSRLVVQILTHVRSDAQQAALLYYVDEMTVEEVAAQLDCSAMTIKRRLTVFKREAGKILAGGEP